MIQRSLSLAALLLGCGTAASAQIISIRTVPVSQSHQFEIFPSSTMSMGGVSMALTDSLLDPFTNPAAGARLRATRFFGSPSVYSVSSDAGGGRTLPLGALTKADSWHGGVWVAVQQVEPSERVGFGNPCAVCLSIVDPNPVVRNRSSNVNTYAFATAGRELGAGGLSVGGSVLWSRLNAIDGVDMLYGGAAGIEQFGHAFDVRLGVLKEWPGDRSLEALVLHNRFATKHDVHYLDTFWDPGQQQFATRTRLERNHDRTNTWGLHLAYQGPITADGWRLGWLATANRMDHPKIPNYEIMNIPRDPGNSSAFNVGVGAARTFASATFGIDVLFEPIWSHTWADAESPVEVVNGDTIAAGGMTIENRFRFANAAVRMGLDQRFEVSSTVGGGLQLGLDVRRFHYWLRQRDHVQLSSRRLEESWVEWKPTWGLSLAFPELELRYRGSVMHGTGRPGVANPGFLRGDVALSGSNILVAPSGPLTLDEVRVTTHEISLSLPLR
ncbi:MAG TPA: hypothetical protein VFZ24_16355 [Longimicrobiales bacterium]